jgi:hypothetical protein
MFINSYAAPLAFGRDEYIFISTGEMVSPPTEPTMRLSLPTSTVSILRQAQAGIRIGAAVAARALDAGIDASDDGSLVELSLDCGEIDALQRLVGAAVSAWENGDLDGEGDVYEALEAARETLNAALDDAHEGELDGLAA